MSSPEYSLHRNGKGRIHGYDAHVSADSYLNEASEVLGESLIHRSSIIDSRILSVKSFSSTLKSTVARRSTLSHAEISFSDLTEVNASECIIEGSHLKKCDVLSLEGVRPHLSCVDLEGVIVEGDVTLRNFNLKGIARIHDGEWSRAPRHIEIVGNDLHVGVTECTNGRAHLACECRPLVWWLSKREHLKKVLSKRGWLSEQIQSVLLAFEEWEAVHV